jgi:hypothetical protein
MNTSPTLTDAIRRPVFSDDATRDKWRARNHSARAAQTVPIAIASSTSLHVVRSGEAIVLSEGQELLRSDFVAGSPVAALLDVLTDREAVIVLDDGELVARATPKSARYVVARGGSVTTARGLVFEGGEVTADHFEGKQVALNDLVRRGAVIDRKPGPPPAAA